MTYDPIDPDADGAYDTNELTVNTLNGLDLSANVDAPLRVDGQTVFTAGQVAPDQSNLAFHLDAAQESFSNNQNTTTITDFSSNGNDLSGDNVTFEANELNGLPAFRFFEDSLSNTNVNFTNPFVAALVYKYDNTGEQFRYFGSTESDNNFMMYADTGEFANRSHSISMSPGFSANIGFSPGVYQTTVYIIDGSNGTIRNNGTQIATGTVGTASFDQLLNVGTANQVASRGIKGYFAELLIYDNLTNISDLESYLSDKWATF